MIPYGRQDISEADINAVIEVLNSEFLTQGHAVPLFEDKMARICNAAHGVAVNSATSALHIACVALGLSNGDWLWTSPNTFVASANCALYCGARVDFVDIDPITYNMSVDCLKSKLQLAEKEGRLPKIVIPVHYAGQPCDMSEIHRLSEIYGFKIIEDASHAVGAFYRKRPVGSCDYSHITVFSFHPVKIITSGEGGMAMTNDVELAGRMRRLRTHGITKDQDALSSHPKHQIWNYEQIELGFNYRMSDIHAALGLSQTDRLNDFVAIRRAIARRYDYELKELQLITPVQLPDSLSSYHLYPIRIVATDKISKQKKIYDELYKKGIGVNLHYIPVHLHCFYKSLGFKRGDCPEAEKFHQEAITLPIFPALKYSEQLYIINALKEVL